MDPTLVLRLDLQTILYTLAGVFFFTLLIGWLYIRITFRRHFKKYRQWIEDHYLQRCDKCMVEMSRRYDTLADAQYKIADELTRLSEDTREQLKLAENRLDLQSDRLELHHRIVDQVVEEVMPMKIVATMIEKLRQAFKVPKEPKEPKEPKR